MQVKNRAWVKNAIIIFLAVMLVLTFFSNTILNYSLPEVAGSYAEPGMILTAIRGTATVTANQSFEVALEETRQIASVLVKAGETIQAGQLLFTLEETDSEELATAIKELQNLELALNKKLVQIKPSDYGDENREIAQAQEDLAELIAKREGLGDHEAALEAAKAAVKAAEARVKAAEAKVKDLEKELAAIEADITALGSDDEYDYQPLLTEAVLKLQKVYQEAIAAEEAAQRAVDKAQADLDNYGGSSGGSNASSIQAQITEKKDEIADLKVGQEEQKHTAIDIIRAKFPALYANYDNPAHADYGNVEKLFSEAQAGGDTEVNAAIALYKNFDSAIMLAETELMNLQQQYDDAVSSSNNSGHYQVMLNNAKNRLAAAKLATADAKKAFERGLKEITNTYKAKQSDKQDQIDAAKEGVTEAQDAQKEAEEAQKEAEDALGVSPEELDKQIKTSQRAIENLLSALSELKSDDSISKAVESLELAADRQVIEEQTALVERLRAKATGTEVTARYGGILTAVNCVVGDKVEAGKALAAIDVAGKGYTASFSVTNEQASKVQVGNTANVGNRWESVLVELIAIRNDPDSQGRKRILEFTVQGDTVSAGQQLDISIGEKNQNYSSVLPNSAIREDADGTFVLVAREKSTPLGTRYTAERIPVTVLVKDATNSAISQDDLEWRDFVITTATKPVEIGSQVRLVD